MRRHFGLKDHGPTLEGGTLAHLYGTPSDFLLGERPRPGQTQLQGLRQDGEGVSKEETLGYMKKREFRY